MSESEEGLIDVDRFFGCETRVACLAGSLTTCKVHKLQLALDYAVHVSIVHYFETQGENSVGAGRGMVQVVRGYNFVFDALVVELDGVFRIVASEHEQVLDSELVSFGPANLETLLLGFVVFECGLIEQVKDLFVVDLQEGAADRDCAVFT